MNRNESLPFACGEACPLRHAARLRLIDAIVQASEAVAPEEILDADPRLPRGNGPLTGTPEEIEQKAFAIIANKASSSATTRRPRARVSSRTRHLRKDRKRVRNAMRARSTRPSNAGPPRSLR